MIIQQTIPTPSMSFRNAAKICFKKFCNCHGRARRSEFWYFFLLVNILMLIPYFMMMYFIVSDYDSNGVNTGFYVSLALLYIILIVMSIPLISAATRRMHDIGKSGAMLLLAIIPFCGFFILLVFLCQDSDQMDNDYGPSPKYTVIQNESLINNPSGSIVYQVSPYIHPQYQIIQPQYQVQTQPLYPPQQYQYNQPQYQYNQSQPQIPQGNVLNNQNTIQNIPTPSEQDNSEEPAPVNLPSEQDLVPKPTASPY